MKQATKNLLSFAFAIAGLFLIFFVASRAADKASAMENQEVKPYVFAELPHGRIYKTVHEGCELYIVETETKVHPQNFYPSHFYSIAIGRGCK
jgi:hypothetical protein